MARACVPFQNLLQRRLDGEPLGVREETRLAGHLAACPECRAFADDLERLAAVMADLPRQKVPPALVARIAAAAQVETEATQGTVTWRNLTWAALVALVGILIVGYQTLVASRGVSLLNLPQALAEWVRLVDLTHIESLFQATSLLAWSVGLELLIGVSLLVVAMFAIIGQVMAHPPAASMNARH